ncbi:MAG: hypothetical protein ACON5C_09595 [Alphaproteobacteria bacterium]
MTNFLSLLLVFPHQSAEERCQAYPCHAYLVMKVIAATFMDIWVMYVVLCRSSHRYIEMTLSSGVISAAKWRSCNTIYV